MKKSEKNLNDNFETKKTNSESLDEDITNKIRKAIIKGDFQPGEKLVQDDLAKTYGVSRMPIREALKKLEYEGLVIHEPYKGAFIREVSKDSVIENYYLRSELEKLALLKSYPYYRKSDLPKLNYLLKKMKETDEANKFIEYNIAFHSALIDKCPWEKLKIFIQNLWDGYPQQTPHLLGDQMERSNKDHYKIVFALENDSPEVAAELLSKHIRETGKRLISYMD